MILFTQDLLLSLIIPFFSIYIRLCLDKWEIIKLWMASKYKVLNNLGYCYLCFFSSAEIKLTESLAAPLVKSVRDEYEAKLREEESRVARREAEVIRSLAIDPFLALGIAANRSLVTSDVLSRYRMADPGSGGLRTGSHRRNHPREPV